MAHKLKGKDLEYVALNVEEIKKAPLDKRGMYVKVSDPSTGEQVKNRLMRAYSAKDYYKGLGWRDFTVTFQYVWQRDEAVADANAARVEYFDSYEAPPPADRHHGTHRADRGRGKRNPKTRLHHLYNNRCGRSRHHRTVAMAQKITIVEREDLGPVLARADHQENVIEVNGKAFYRLPPMVQEFVLCHEVCHLRHDEWDEARTNALAAQLFLARAADEADRAERERFLSYIDGEGGYTNFDPLSILSIIGSAFSLGSTVFGIIKNRNAGWYSWDRATQRDNLRVMLDQAFTQSRRSARHSAEEYLWAQLQNYTNKDDSLGKFLSRGENSWVKSEIRSFEADYGFKLADVTPLDLTAFPLLVAAIGAAIGWAAYSIVKNRK